MGGYYRHTGEGGSIAHAAGREKVDRINAVDYHGCITIQFWLVISRHGAITPPFSRVPENL